MAVLIYKNGLSVVLKDEKRLENETKPYLSFDFDELYFTQNRKIYIKNLDEYTLTKEQIDEIEAFIENIKEDEDINIIKKLMHFLHSTDWMVIRELETGKKMPEHIKKEREAYRKKLSEIKASKI